MPDYAEKISNASTLLAPCPLCGQPGREALKRRNLPIHRCGSCGFMFTPIPAALDLTQIYQDDGYWNGSGECHGTDCYSYDTQWRKVEPFYRARLKRLRDFCRSGTMLEIGCADGRFLGFAQLDGWQVSGVELSPTMRQAAIRRLQRPVHANLDEAVAAGRTYDCVVMFEVVEHLREPVPTLQLAARLMKPGGVLALSTPNCESERALDPNLDRSCFIPPEHVGYFSPRTLAACVERAGFRSLALEGLTGFAALVIESDVMLPAWLQAVLRPIRRGKRLRPYGLIGRWMKQVYGKRVNLYRAGPDADFTRVDILELYARKA